MDTPKQYIDMRLAAIPDMGMGIPCKATPFCYWAEDTVWVDIKGDWYYSTESQVVQLERQDQLQAMADTHSLFELVKLFESFCFLLKWPVFYTSMEQLWLAFVMKEKYNKAWNGAAWE